MDVGIEISLYPMTGNAASLIHDFIERLSVREDLKVLPGSLSTQVFGDFEHVFALVREAVRETLEVRRTDGARTAVVLKVLGPL